MKCQKNKIAKLIAKDLLKIKAVFLSPDKPFIWASGIKSPIYCDNRLTLSTTKVRLHIEKALAEIIKEKYPNAEMIIGTATAGIPHAAIVAHMLNLPMGYVRSSNKDHGRKNRIEGKVPPRSKVVVIEDLISTGGSSIEVVKHLKECNIKVLGVVSIFTYGMKKSIDTFKKNKTKFTSLTDFDTIIDVAVKNKFVKLNDKKKLLAFRDNPSDERWIKA